MTEEKEVYFSEYCPRCKHEDVEESDPYQPCNDCLNEPFGMNSHKPAKFEEATE